jgi:hypothetical protein
MSHSREQDLSASDESAQQRLCGVCSGCQTECATEFCDTCARDVARDMQDAWGLVGPQLRLVSDEPTWGTGCNNACGHCGACT